VGIEALSRGCVAAHFVEMDPWVVAQVLDANLSSTGFQGQAVVHTTQVEVLLQQAVNHGCMLPAILSLFWVMHLLHCFSSMLCCPHYHA
jgi:16S rRNA G966 N2-methylase RsmD